MHVFTGDVNEQGALFTGAPCNIHCLHPSIFNFLIQSISFSDVPNDGMPYLYEIQISPETRCLFFISGSKVYH